MFYVFEVMEVGFVSFRFGRGSEVSSGLNRRSSSCTNEQKGGPYACKKTTNCKSRTLFVKSAD